MDNTARKIEPQSPAQATSGPTQECPYCASTIAKKATKCPNCGEFIRRPLSVLLFVGVLILPAVFSWFTLRKGHSAMSRLLAFGWLAFVLYLFFGGSPQDRLLQQETNIRLMSGEKPLSKSELITLEKFNRLKTGMSYSEVVGILGRNGEPVSENEIAGIKTEMFQWSNGISSMNAMFQNGELIQKAQFGLK